MSTLLGKILADFTTSLASDLAVGGTTATLSSATDDDGVALPSGRYFFTIDGSNSLKEHISCDLVGTALTNIKSLSRQGVETTGVVKKHRIGSTVSLTDFGHIKFINDLVSGSTSLNSGAPLGYDGAPASLTGNQLATVTYVLGVVNGGTVTFDQQVISAQTSGEALAINDVVYFKESDAKWYKADADLTATFDTLQLGVNKTTAGASDVTIQVAISGPVSAFSGLTAGSKYYLSNTAGAISTSAGTNSVFVGVALTTTILLFSPVPKTLPTQKEKDAIAGGSTFGTPSSTNKFITQDYNSSATGMPVVNTYTTTDTVYGAATSQFDISNPAGTTFRYTWDGNGTDPGITAILFPIGSGVVIQGQNFTAANNGIFLITGSGASYFEVTNASGVAELNKTLGTGYIARTSTIWTKPSGLKFIVVETQAPGASGGSAATASAIEVGRGGSSGGYSKKMIQASSLGSTVAVAVGGNNTSSTFAVSKISGFGSHLYATGGQIERGTAGSGFSGDLNINGKLGAGGGIASALEYGYGMGAGADSVMGLGGQSRYDGGAGDQIGYDGTGYGSGGSGGYNTNNAGNPQNGGLGRQGLVILTEYYS